MNERWDLPGQSQLDFDAGIIVGEVDRIDRVTFAKSTRQKAGQTAADCGFDLLFRDSLFVGVQEVAVLDPAESTPRVPT